MKVLTMCQGGNSRSVACAYLLKYKYGVDALACGWEKNSTDTLDMLCLWADYVIIMQTCFEIHISPEHRYKLKIVDVGPDVWCNGLHPGLLAEVDSKLEPLMEELK